MSGHALERRSGRELNLGWCGITRLGLVVKEKPTPDQLAALGETLTTLEGGIAWLVGDYLALAERLGKEGEEYAKVASELIAHEEWSSATVRTYQWVCEKVPAENRRNDLSFNHHQIVAALPANQQREWLNKAAGDGGAESWSSGRLKHEIASAQSGGEEPTTEYLVTVSFASPAPRDQLAHEWERVGHPVFKNERTKRPKKDSNL